MRIPSCYLLLCRTLCVALFIGTASAATFGTAVAIGGQASDIALDEPRGVLYIANFTANRIDVMTLADGKVRRSINVAAQPGSISISPDGQYLVVAHFGNFAAPSSSKNALTVIHLADSARQSFGMAFPPLGVAFGNDGLALIVTTTDFLLFDPVSGNIVELDTISGLVAKTLPQPLATFPPQIVSASMNVNGDSSLVIGLTDTIEFSYNVRSRQIVYLGYTSSPTQGPRVVSVSRDGSFYLSGWVLYGCGGGGFVGCNAAGPSIAQFPSASGLLNVGSHAIDSASGTVYAEIPKTATDPPVLMIADADNLNVRERLRMPEHLAGKSLLNAAADTMYSVSDSGVMVLPVGALSRAPRVSAVQEDLVFRANFCDRSVAKQVVTIVDAGGGNVPFTLSADNKNVTISPFSGITPANITVSVDPNAFANQNGTVTATLTINAPGAINIPPTIRVLINTREPDQRGTIVNVPGTLVDLLADPVRDRFYVLRQDRDQVLVFDGSNYNQLATIRTSNTPTQMAMTFDRNYLLVGHSDSQLVYIYNLATWQKVGQIQMPPGHYPLSIAAASHTILAASRGSNGTNTIDRIDFASGTAVAFPSLGVFQNSINLNTVLIAAPNGSSILGAMADGNVFLYESTADTFTVSRKDTKALSGAYAASMFNQFVVGNTVLNASLVPTLQFDSSNTIASGFAFLTDGGLAFSAGPSAGIMKRVTLATGQVTPATRLAESPLVNPAGFTRTLAPLANGNTIVTLTTSGLLVMPTTYDAAVSPPRLDSLTNAADLTQPVAPGGLVTLFGANLSPISIATREIPLPTALGDSCLTVNGALAPLIFASPAQINAQLPFNIGGNATLVLRTPGGVSDNMNVTILPNAPAVFRTNTGGVAIVRLSDGKLITNDTPIHLNDKLTIYLTGLGATLPAVTAGNASPSNPLSAATVNPTIRLGNSSIFVLWSGLAPNQVGLNQINAQVPFHGIPTGDNIPLIITQGTYTTTVLVRVLE